MIPGFVVALATALRLGWVLCVPTRPVGDFSMYLESAAHLVEHGALDPEFVYMPGYVFLLALVQRLGGGLLACKLVNVALAGGATGAIWGITVRLWGRREALLAALLYAVWPAGIAVTSVTGTDLPTAALVAMAAWCLVRFGEEHPVRAALLFGLVMGLAAWMRAVAMPLAVLAAVYFRASGAPWPRVARHTALACLAAVLVLAPWAVRNRLRYGETFFTDSHGGLTALVGANPDTDGAYSRSLNRIFLETTGYKLLAEPHREADRAAYALAKRWSRLEPAYAAGLVATKAERLLGREQPLLYWPIYRRGVLPEAQQSWFRRHQRAIEGLTEGFWFGLVGAGLFGLGLAVARRRWVALAFVPLQLALLGIYALFFAEARYQLPIVMFLFPAAGAALAWAREGRACARQGLVAAGVAALVLLAWQTTTWAGQRLRERHRWAIGVCHVGGRAVSCAWRPEGPSGIRGVWSGVGLAGDARARMELEVPAGTWRVSARLDLAPVEPAAGTVRFEADGAAVEVARGRLETESRVGRVVPLELLVTHPGGPLSLRLSSQGAGPRVWLDDLRVEAP
jgi:4-amino-4-deoxy-L-arabinose transferase-like glycosyltransferase